MINDFTKLLQAGEDSSAIIDPNNMSIGQYYLAVIDDIPYIYRKIKSQELEIYGLSRNIQR